MPLVSASITAEIMDKFSKPNKTAAAVWPTVAKAYCNTYLQAGMNAAPGGACTGVPGVATLATDLIEIHSSLSKSYAIVAPKVAKAFDAALMTFISVYQNTIVTTAGVPQLINDLINAAAAPVSDPTKYPRELAKALDVYTKSAIVSGIIPGSPPVPFTGPIT